MKTSLLLMSLVMGAGLVGTAQAASTTAAASSIPDVHQPALVATSMSGNGVLSTLGDLLTGKSAKKHDSAPACDHDALQPTDKSTHACPPQGAAHPGASNNPHAQRPAGSAGASRSSNGSSPLPSAASSAEAVLGWQSLLPGSIQ